MKRRSRRRMWNKGMRAEGGKELQKRERRKKKGRRGEKRKGKSVKREVETEEQ